MKKLKYTEINNKIYVNDIYSKRTSNLSTTYTTLVGLDKDMKIVSPLYKKRNLKGYVDVLSNSVPMSELLKNPNHVFHDIERITYFAECILQEQGGKFNLKPVQINIIAMSDNGDLVLKDVTTQIPYPVRVMLTNNCYGYLQLRM